MTNHIGLVYVENDNKQSRLMRLGTTSDETRQDNNVTDLTCVVYTENDIELL